MTTTKRSATHDTFAIERIYPAAPSRVFKAFADPAAKSQWFAAPEEWESGRYELDFRIGGRERASGRPPGGLVHTYEATYQDIVPDQRIVTTYVMYLDQTRISVSVATIELEPSGRGTRLRLTEQGVFLDGADTGAQRERGTRELLDALGRSLEREPARA
jgi:uncharacterized protein YndB with AHSA1/START domain